MDLGVKQDLDLGVKQDLDIGVKQDLDLGVKQNLDLGVKQDLDLGVKQVWDLGVDNILFWCSSEKWIIRKNANSCKFYYLLDILYVKPISAKPKYRKKTKILIYYFGA